MNNRERQAPADAEALPWQHLPVLKTGQGFSLLSGIRVVDLTTSIAGPYGTMLLADFGAEVIKVERPEGDDARQWGPPFLNGEALWFSAVNRNKKSVQLDLNSSEGQQNLLLLAQTADVLVTNHSPRVQQKFGFAYEQLRELRNDIVHVSITGFGVTGERAELACYDLIAEGYSGIMDITGASDSPPQKVGAPAADMLAGQDAAMATLAALFGRQQTGEGRSIEISLVESMTRFMACRISSYLGSGEVPVRSGGTDSVIAIYQSFQTADLPINLGLGSDAIWQRFWKTLGQPEYAARPEFATNYKRREARAEIVALIQEYLLQHGREHWLEVFARARVPAGPINRVDEVVADKALLERGMFFTLEDEAGDRLVPQIGLGIRMDGDAATPRNAPPLLGEHTNEVLNELQEWLRSRQDVPAAE